MTISALAVRRSSRWWPRFLAMDGCEFSPAVSSAGDHSLSGGCLREAVGLSVGDHGGNANGLRWTLSPDGLACVLDVLRSGRDPVGRAKCGVGSGPSSRTGASLLL